MAGRFEAPWRFGGAMSEWRSLLICSQRKRGKETVEIPLPTVANAIAFLAHEPNWDGVLVYDGFRETITTRKPPPWDDVDKPAQVPGEWCDSDSTRARAWIMRHYGVDFTLGAIEEAIAVVAARVVVHPVRDWLDSLRWDAQRRLDGLFVDYFGAADTAYTRGVGARFAIGAVARLYRPGAQVDCTPVLEGAQGIGKSTGLKALVGPQWYFDSPIAMGDKDGYQALRGKWVGSLDELHSLSRSDLSRAKAFLTATSDTYRESYARRTRDFQRQCVFVGTTNAAQWLKDESGNRRFWPVRCGKIDREAIERDRPQIWAEARARFESGEPWHVNTEEFRKLCEDEQEDRFIRDVWEEPIGEWIMNPGKPERRAQGVTLADVLTGALDMKADRWGATEQARCSAILRRLGWEPGRQRRLDGVKVRPWTPCAARLAPQSSESDTREDTREADRETPSTQRNLSAI
jgi:putative DNA primase/helicase